MFSGARSVEARSLKTPGPQDTAAGATNKLCQPGLQSRLAGSFPGALATLGVQ